MSRHDRSEFSANLAMAAATDHQASHTSRALHRQHCPAPASKLYDQAEANVAMPCRIADFITTIYVLGCLAMILGYGSLAISYLEEGHGLHPYIAGAVMCFMAVAATKFRLIHRCVVSLINLIRS